MWQKTIPGHDLIILGTVTTYSLDWSGYYCGWVDHQLALMINVLRRRDGLSHPGNMVDALADGKTYRREGVVAEPDFIRARDFRQANRAYAMDRNNWDD